MPPNPYPHGLPPAFGQPGFGSALPYTQMGGTATAGSTYAPAGRSPEGAAAVAGIMPMSGGGTGGGSMAASHRPCLRARALVRLGCSAAGKIPALALSIRAATP